MSRADLYRQAFEEDAKKNARIKELEVWIEERHPCECHHFEGWVCPVCQILHRR